VNVLLRRGAYTGRLAFDPDSGFHVDPKGKRVVTHDEGRSWRYATRKDLSHNARYEKRKVTVDSTDNFHLGLVAAHGRVVADQQTREEQPHHFEVQPDDPHFGGVQHHTDAEAPTKTSHTEAWQ
jgi:hypothetical protein